MLSATASLGLIHMWDVDGGLVPIDKCITLYLHFNDNKTHIAMNLNIPLHCRYLYTNEDFIKSGALLAIGLVNCGIRNECDRSSICSP